MNKFKILVCGGRDFNNRLAVNSVLAEYKSKYGHTGMIIIEGAAKGADKLAHLWAIANNVENWRFPITKEDWKKYGNAAGPIRNEAMFNESQPDLVIAFPGGNGTKHMINYSKSKGCEVIEVNCKKDCDSEIQRKDKEFNDILKWCMV